MSTPAARQASPHLDSDPFQAGDRRGMPYGKGTGAECYGEEIVVESTCPLDAVRTIARCCRSERGGIRNWNGMLAQWPLGRIASGYR